MLHTILVPLDGSAFAETALPTAFHLARRDKAEVRLVMVQEPALPVMRTRGTRVVDPTFDQDIRQEARRYLDELLGRIPASDRSRTRTELLEGGIVETLAAHTREAKADLVVMTTHARGGMSRAWLGSVADGLLRRSPVPVLLLRPDDGAKRGEDVTGFRRVLIPVDGSAVGDQVIERAAGVAGTEGVQYTLLRVLAATMAPTQTVLPRRGETPATQAQRATVEHQLEATADVLRSRGLAVEVRIGVNDNPARAILDYEEEWSADLVAMATRSRGGVERLVLGSVADKVLRGSDCPLLVWNPLEADEG